MRLSSPNHSDLDPLVRAAATGDVAAFAALYGRTAAQVHGVIVRILGRGEDAAETLQETYLKVWQVLSEYDPARASPLTWIMVIARHRAIDRLRRRALETRHGSTEPWEELTAGLAAPAGAPAPDRLALMRCLEHIEPEHRDCVLLAYCEGLSREELAERFARPVNTIKTWLRRTLQSLRNCIEAA